MGHHQLANLIKMVNQIAVNNAHSGSDDEQAAIVANHLRKFWARSMKEQIAEYAQQGGDQLNPIAKKAIAEI